MKVVREDLWGFADLPGVVLCIPTNGCIRMGAEGVREGVMGAGVAMQASKRYPGLAQSLARTIDQHGNVPAVLRENPLLVSFPTKHGMVVATQANKSLLMGRYRGEWKNGHQLPGWMFRSDPELIECSAHGLAILIGVYAWKQVYLPCPGCENGGLEWPEVEKILDRHLDPEKVICVSRP